MPSDADKIRVADLLEEILKSNKVTVYCGQDRDPTRPPRAIEVGDGYWYIGDSLLSCLEQAVAEKEERDA